MTTNHFDEIAAQVGSIIARERNALGISRSRLSELTSQHGKRLHRHAAIQKIEAGERHATLSELQVIASALRVPVATFLEPLVAPKHHLAELLNCQCRHPRHHHAGGNMCRTVTVSGPPSPPDASAHLEHPGRNWGRCNCTQYQAGS